MKIKVFTIILILILWPTPNHGQEPSGDTTACQACHGKQLEGNPLLSAPRIAGMNKQYIEKQLHNFKKGLRGNHKDDTFGQQMAAATATLSKEHITALSMKIDAQSANSDLGKASGDPMLGKKYFYSNCSACHGGNGQGNPGLKAPSLLNLNQAYLTRQLLNFRKALRGTEKQDVSGRQMAMMAKILPNEQAVEDVVAFILQLQE